MRQNKLKKIWIKTKICFKMLIKILKNNKLKLNMIYRTSKHYKQNWKVKCKVYSKTSIKF